jgi:arylsulfatase A-like enzyme
MPTILDILGIKTKLKFDGRSLAPLWTGGEREAEPEMYLTEATWMRKHGWRTPEWKLIVALEPDFHFKPEIELYNLIKDPEENHNVADENPEVVEMLKKRMYDFIEKREKETGRPAPIYTNFLMNDRPFTSSQEAYDSKYIGGIADAVKLQQKN